MMRIVVVEDEIRIREGISRLLKKLNEEYEIVGAAENGQEGLALIRELKPDVVITDIRMPVMDGLEAARNIRALKRPDAVVVPIFAMTANAYEEDKEMSRKAGMNEHLSKPIEAGILCRMIRKYTDQRKKKQLE